MFYEALHHASFLGLSHSMWQSHHWISPLRVSIFIIYWMRFENELRKLEAIFKPTFLLSVRLPVLIHDATVQLNFNGYKILLLTISGSCIRPMGHILDACVPYDFSDYSGKLFLLFYLIQDCTTPEASSHFHSCTTYFFLDCCVHPILKCYALMLCLIYFVLTLHATSGIIYSTELAKKCHNTGKELEVNRRRMCGKSLRWRF